MSKVQTHYVITFSLRLSLCLTDMQLARTHTCTHVKLLPSVYPQRYLPQLTVSILKSQTWPEFEVTNCTEVKIRADDIDKYLLMHLEVFFLFAHWCLCALLFKGTRFVLFCH